MSSSIPPQGEPLRKEPLFPGLLEDLAVLLSGKNAVYFRLEPEGAVLAVASPATRPFGESESRWEGMSPTERARRVLEWIRKAAEVYRHPRVRQPIPQEREAS